MRSVSLIIAIFGAFVVLNESAIAQALSWYSISGVPGCIAVEEGGGGKLFAVSDGSAGFNGVLYSSTDEGGSWYPTSITYGLITEIVGNGNNLVLARLVATGANPIQAFQSTDNGVTWTGIMSGDPFLRPYSGYMYSDAGNIFTVAGYPNGQLIKLNGQRWDLIGTQIPPVSFSRADFSGAPTPTAIDHDERIYVGTLANGLFITSNYGSTWRQSLAGLYVTAVKVGSPQFVVAATSPNTARNGGVFFSSDTGATWTFLGLAEQSITSLAIDDAGTILASTERGLYRYGGTPNSWDDISPSQEEFGDVLVDGNHAYFGASVAKGVFRSVDQGLSWERSGIPREDIGSLLLTSAGSVVAGSYGNRVFVTSNNGGTWGQTYPGSICDNVFALLEAGPNLHAGTDCGGYRSQDGGKTWANMTEGDVAGAAYAMARNSAGKLFAGTNFGMYVSGDDGTTWVSSGIGFDRIIGVAVNSADEVFGLSSTNGVFRSTDGGQTWANIGLVRSDLQTIGIGGSNAVFVGADGGVFRSTDNGASWQYLAITNAFVYALAFPDPLTAVAATGHGVFISIDGGASWVQRNSGLYQSVILSLGVDAQGYLYAGALHGGVYKSNQVVADVAETRQRIPREFSLLQNYPNPFNPSTSIEFHIDAPALTTLEVFTLLGERVATLVNEPRGAGVHRVTWSAGEFPSGVYVYRLRSGNRVESKKMLLMR